jgi:ubiquinone/menaquinone biosynthesis C-methylase UbiE
VSFGSEIGVNAITKVGKLVAAYNYSPAVIPVLIKAAWTRRLPNTRQVNRALWGWHDWSDDGNEWSNKGIVGWKSSLVEKVLKPFVADADAVLEIGPGAGRWTEHIVKLARRTVLVDVTPECIQMCRARFGASGDVQFLINDGRSLTGVASGSINRIWSFDVFVHILAADVEAYVAEFQRVLAPGGEAMIHHAKRGTTAASSWRSDLTADEMRRIVESHGLEIVRQFESWGGEHERLWPERGREDNLDVISHIRKPAQAAS